MGCPNRIRPMWRALIYVRTWPYGVSVCGFEPETNFFFFIIISFTLFELLASTSGLFRILSCRLTNMGIIAISEPYINEMLRYTWARMPCFRQTNIAIPSHPDCNTHTQSGWPNTLDDTQLQIFNDLQENFQDILRAVKAIVAARKNGRGGARNADGMDATVWERNHHFLRPIRTDLNFFAAWWAIRAKFSLFHACLLWSEHIWRNFWNFVRTYVITPRFSEIFIWPRHL